MEEDAPPPLLLLHASGVAGWSWLDNVEELSKHYRTYAIDTLGDAGKSVLSDLNNYPQDGQTQSDLYTEITDKLGVEQAYVVGASEGGFIGTNDEISEAPDPKGAVLGTQEKTIANLEPGDLPGSTHCCRDEVMVYLVIDSRRYNPKTEHLLRGIADGM